MLPAIRSIILKVIRDTNGKAVRSVNLVLGEISNLDQVTLQNHWTQLTRDTPLEHAQTHIHLITAEVQCMACFSKYHPVNKRILCPQCGSFGAKILSGEEFGVESIETDYGQA